jgi:putative transposase
MVRAPRLKIDNARYHIFNRGNQKQVVFHDDQDFDAFLSILAHYKLKYKFKLYHLCPMPNHFHLELKINRAEIMPKAMKDITLSYTNYYHQKYATVGQLWQGRYKSMIVEEQEYADKLGGYIERNPVRAGLVKEPGEWRWSSYRFYAYGEPLRVLTKWLGEEKEVDLIDEDPIYKEFGSMPAERQKNYREFIRELDDGRIKEELGLVERKRGRPRKER